MARGSFYLAQLIVDSALCLIHGVTSCDARTRAPGALMDECQVITVPTTSLLPYFPQFSVEFS